MDKCAEDDNRTHGHEDHSNTTRQERNMQITTAVFFIFLSVINVLIVLKITKIKNKKSILKYNTQQIVN